MSKINASVTVKFVQVDLASQASIRSAAKSISSFVDKIDILINSAGVMALEEFQTTKEGVEIQFGTNHLGHFLLTNLIMSKILAAGKGARIVNLSSTGFELAGVRFDDYNFKVREFEIEALRE
jgi:NAD(P)-dependent dehydrogenase (short-subunit alcohol dehydrogenase family)